MNYLDYIEDFESSADGEVLEDGIYLVSFDHISVSDEGSIPSIDSVMTPVSRCYVEDQSNGLLVTHPNTKNDFVFKIFPFVMPKDRNGKKIEDVGLVPNGFGINTLHQFIRVLMGVRSDRDIWKAHSMDVHPNYTGEEFSVKQGRKFVKKESLFRDSAYDILVAYSSILEDYVVDTTEVLEKKMVKGFLSVSDDQYKNVRFGFHPDGTWSGLFTSVGELYMNQMSSLFSKDAEADETNEDEGSTPF